MIIITAEEPKAKDILDFARCQYIELVPTTELPTQDGLYRAKYKETGEMVWIYVEGRNADNFDYEGSGDVSEYTDWTGPIPEPEKK